MPAPSLTVPWQNFRAKHKSLSVVAEKIGQLEPSLQKLIAEMVLIRLFDDLQEAIAGIAYRLACGRPYLDGTVPRLLVDPARSLSAARDLFENQARNKRQRVKWSKVSYIRETIRNVIDLSDPFVVSCDAIGVTYAEMQAIRNRIAHKNQTTRQSFDPVVRRYYGGVPKGVSPGLLLINTRGTTRPLDTYLATSLVLVRAATVA